MWASWLMCDFTLPRWLMLFEQIFYRNKPLGAHDHLHGNFSYEIMIKNKMTEMKTKRNTLPIPMAV